MEALIIVLGVCSLGLVIAIGISLYYRKRYTVEVVEEVQEETYVESGGPIILGHRLSRAEDRWIQPVEINNK